MKKLSLLIVLSLAAALIFLGCNNNTIKIDEYTWAMMTIQSTNDNGKVIAYGNDENSTFETAVLVQLKCKEENGVLTLTDSTNNRTYTGSYKAADTNPDSVIYDVKIGDTSGKAVCSLTTYRNEKNKPTLLLNLGDYTLKFFADSAK